MSAAIAEIARKALFGKDALLVDLRMHPDDVTRLRFSGDRAISWDGPADSHVGGLRFCGFRLLPDRSLTPGEVKAIGKLCE